MIEHFFTKFMERHRQFAQLAPKVLSVAEAVMIPYRVSVLASNSLEHKTHDIKLYATYAETDEEALRTVSDAMPNGWQVDRVAGLLSRVEVERLQLAHGEVREVSSFTIDGLFLPEDALYASNDSRQLKLH